MYKIVKGITKLKNPTRTFPTKLVGSTGYVATEPANIVQILNEHFASIGHLMSQSIAVPPIHVNSVSPHTSNCSSFFLQPSTSAEVLLTIDKLKIKKSSKIQ